MEGDRASGTKRSAIAAKADLRGAQVKRATASDRSHNRGDKRTDEATIA
jgi:hypothetical protein